MLPASIASKDLPASLGVNQTERMESNTTGVVNYLYRSVAKIAPSMNYYLQRLHSSLTGQDLQILLPDRIQRDTSVSQPQEGGVSVENEQLQTSPPPNIGSSSRPQVSKRPTRRTKLPVRYRLSPSDSIPSTLAKPGGTKKRRLDNFETVDAKRAKIIPSLREGFLSQGTEAVADSSSHIDVPNFGYPVGQGVYVSQSKHIPECNGLMAGRVFKKGEIITWYHGKEIESDASGESDTDFSRSFQLTKTLILVGEESASLGSGGAAFVNDLKPNNANLSKKLLTDEDRQVFKTANICIPDSQKNTVRLRATREIQKNEEITAPYGSGYWSHHKKVFPNIKRIDKRKPI